LSKPASKPRILFIRLTALGDVVHSLPAAAALKAALPESSISWVAEQSSYELVANNPAVDEVIVFPKKALAELLKSPARWTSPPSDVKGFLDSVRGGAYDIAIDMQGLLKSAMIAFLSGAPIRVGFARAREFAPVSYTHRMPADYFAFDKHVVDHNLALAEFALNVAGAGDSVSGGSVSFPLPEPEPSTVKKFNELLAPQVIPEEKASSRLPDSGEPPQTESDDSTASGTEDGAASPPVESTSSRAEVPDDSVLTAGVARGSVIALIPGTTWTSKIWPGEKWGELAERITKIRDVRIVIVGGPSEVETNLGIARRIAGSNVIDLTGKTTLLDLVALFRSVDMVIGADTGPLHLATAAGVEKVIGIYGSTPIGRNGPYGQTGFAVSAGLSCQPCFKKVCPLSTRACLVDMDSRWVLEEISTFLEISRKTS